MLCGRLVKLGRPAHGVLAKIIERTGPSDRQAIALTLTRAVSDELPRLIQGDDLAGTERLLEIGLAVEGEPAQLSDHYVAVILLADRLAAVRPKWDERARNGSVRAAEIAFALARAAGDKLAARRFAKLSGRDELAEQILWEQGDWAALAAREPLGSIGPMGPSALTIGLKAFCQRMAGNTIGAADTLRRLTTGAESVEHSAQGLMLNERPDAALTLLSSAPVPVIRVRPARLPARLRGRVHHR